MDDYATLLTLVASRERNWGREILKEYYLFLCMCIFPMLRVWDFYN